MSTSFACRLDVFMQFSLCQPMPPTTMHMTTSNLLVETVVHKFQSDLQRGNVHGLITIWNTLRGDFYSLLYIITYII